MPTDTVDTAIVAQNVLVVDDELNIRRTLTMCLEADGHDVVSVSNAEDAIAEAGRRAFDIVFLDIRLGTSNGLDLIAPLLAEAPWLKIVVITAHASIDTAVEAMRRGVSDYLPKPFTPSQVGIAVQKASEIRALEQRIEALQAQADQGSEPLILTSDSPIMQRALKHAEQVGGSDAAVLLRGENGTGKTMMARAIHRWSKRAGKALGVISCPSLSAQLLESELFGHVKGAFTGAVKDNPGRVAMCEGGTLFLDEIGDLPMELQPKLLRFLQEKEYERVGDAITRRADVRVITATNVDLEAAVKEGRFREDLFYRLNVVEIDIPPLRERKEDLIALADRLLAAFSRQEGKRILGLSEEARDALHAHDWPGNVRELRNVLERSVIFCADGYVKTEHFPLTLQDKQTTPELGDHVSLAKLEELHIRRVLASTKSLQQAADILGIDQATLWRRRKQYDI